MSEKDLHELLPWYVAGTLGAGETKAFETHLGRCPDCAREHRVWTDLQKTLERHGEGFLADHPAPEALVAAILPDHDPRPSEQQRLAVEHHLAMCPTCAEEARWIRGESAASAGPGTTRVWAAGATRVGRRAWIGPVAGVAAGFVLALAVLFPSRPSRVATATSLIEVHQIQATTRAAGSPASVRLPADAGSFHLLLEVEPDGGVLPVRLTIERADGRRIYEADGIARDDLFRERFLFVACRRSDYPDGDYVAKVVTPPDGGRATEYPFRVSGVSTP
jgi:hypothetical protein